MTMKALKAVVLKLKNKVTMMMHHRDMLLNVCIGNLKHAGELQLHIESIKAIKPKAHRLYDLLRSYGWEGESL